MAAEEASAFAFITLFIVIAGTSRRKSRGISYNGRMDVWALYIILLFAMLISLGLAVLQLPGVWMLLLFASGYAWLTDWSFIGPWTLVVLVAIAIGAEVIETLASAAGAGKAGASKRAMILSIVGALVGGIVFTFIAIPVIGTIIGVCVGACVGGAGGELWKGRTGGQAMRVGMGAAAGRLVGTVVKLSAGIVMFMIAAIAAIPWTSSSSPQPATSPSGVLVSFNETPCADVGCSDAGHPR